MRDTDVIDQLRRYGDAVERAALGDPGDLDGPDDLAARRRRPRPSVRVLAVAAAALAVLVGGVALAALGAGDDRPTRITTAGPDPTASTTPDAALPAGTIAGTATWVGGRDARADLRVGACPLDATAPGCPDLRSTAVDPDGTFTLVLPPGVERWRIAAYVTTDRSGCVFDCEWRGAQVGESTTLSAVDVATPALDLQVSARVVDILVRDRNGAPFAGGGVQVTAVDGDVAPIFALAGGDDGRARVVVDPGAVYDIHAQARDMGWPDPQWTNDGSEFWFSPDETFAGAEIPDGHVLRVDGAPAPSADRDGQ